jgi:hypothetical protein
MVLAIHLGFSALAWHGPVRSQKQLYLKNKLHAYLDKNLWDYLS